MRGWVRSSAPNSCLFRDGRRVALLTRRSRTWFAVEDCLRYLNVKACGLRLTLAVLALWLPFSMPLRAVSFLGVQRDGTNVALSWNSVPGVLYELQSRTSLVTGSWQTVTSLVAVANSISWTSSVAGTSAKFYQLHLPSGEISLAEPPEAPPGQPCSCGQSSPGPVGVPNV